MRSALHSLQIAGKDLPALKEFIDKASLKDIFDEVECVLGN
ncbi:MAG: hypothetical protein ACQ9MH_27530 [Nitrospinales bacterium]